MNPFRHLRTERFHAGLALTICCLLIFSWFSPVLLNGRLLAPLDILHEMLLPWRGDSTLPNVHNHFVSDAVTQYLPYRYIAAESLQRDGFLGWNPYVFGGTPFYMDTMATPYDWTIQLHRWMPFWTAWHFGIICQFLIAGIGMFVLLRSERIDPTLCLLGALTFAGGAPFFIWIYHRWALGSFCWMPWIVWTLKPVSYHPVRWKLGACFLAMAFCGGTLQHSVFVVLTVLGVWAASLLESRGKYSQQIQVTTEYFLAGIFGAGLAAFSLVPSVLGFAENVLGGFQTRGGFGYPRGSSQPLLNALSYLAYPFPWILGTPSSLDMWKLLKSNLLHVCYFGFIPTALALILVWFRFLPLAPRILVSMGLLIPLTPLVGPLYHRVNLLFLFGGSWLVACALQQLLPETLRRIAKWLAVLFSLISFMWLLLSAAAAVLHAPIERKLHQIVLARAGESQFGVFPDWLKIRASQWLADFPLWSSASFPLWILACAGVICISQWHARRRALFRSLLILVVLAEISIFANRWLTFVDPKVFPPYPETPLIATIRSHIHDGRLSLPSPSLGTSVLPPNTLIPFRIPVLQGYDSIHPRFSLGEKYSPSIPQCEIQRLGIALAVFDGNPPPQYQEWPILSADQYTLMRSPSVPSRYLATAGSTIFPCSVELESPNARVLKLPQNASSIFIAESWDPGWRATDQSGTELQIERVNSGGMRIRISPGQPSSVFLNFHPIRYYNGLLVTILAGVLITLFSIVGFMRRRNIHQEPI